MGTINLLDLRTVSWRITHPFTVASSCSDSNTTSLHLHTRKLTHSWRTNPRRIAPCVACLRPMLSV